jgi:hypothetical protein
MHPIDTGASLRPECAILCTIKNEATYIFEHYAWYKRIGFTRFIYAYNDCTDQTVPVLATLAAYDPQVTVVQNVLQPGDRPQMSAYAQARARILPQMPDWYILVVDIDEFLLLKQHDSIQDLLEAFTKPDVTSFNWRIFGSNGQSEYADDLVVSRFTACAAEDYPTNRIFKSIWRNTPAVVDNGPHRPHFRTPEAIRWVYPTSPPLGRDMPLEFRKGSNPKQTGHGPFLDIAQVNHYIVKSRSEFDEKKLRGRGWGKAGNPRRDRHNSDFFSENDRNEVVDNLAASRSCEVRQETVLLRQKFLEMHGCELGFIKLGGAAHPEVPPQADKLPGL